MGRIEHSLEWYRFIGRIVGKAIYEGHSVSVQFAGFFLRKVPFIRHSRGDIDDLSVVARETRKLPG
jgi:hypothetical protein